MAPNKRDPAQVQRTYWIDRELHTQAATKAMREDTNLSAVIRAALDRYVKGKP